MRKKHDIVPDASTEDLVKKETPANTNENKLIIKILAAIAVATVVMGMIFYISYRSQLKTDSYFALIYSRQGVDYLKSSKGTLELKNDSGKSPIISKNSKVLFYFTASKKSSNNIDLYCCDLTSKRQIKNGGFIVDTGIGGDIKLNETGSIVIYSKKSDSTGENGYYFFNTNKKKNVKIDSNIKEFYILPNEAGVYYTKVKESKTALFKYEYNQKPLLISDSVKKITYYEASLKNALIYETYEEDRDLFGINFISEQGEPKLISGGVSAVLYDRYTVGGNLYYFKTTDESTGWEEIIPDDLKLQDEQITQPNPNDYKLIFGYNYNYRKALTEYQAKTQRDELRASLKRAINDENLIPERTDCYATNLSEDPVKVVKGVSPGNILTTSNSDQPAVVFNKHEYLKSDTTFSKLSSMLGKRDISYLTTYAADIIKEVSANKGAYLSVPANTDGVSLNISNEEVQGSEFGFSADGNDLYIIIKDAKVFNSTLYKISIEGAGVSRKDVIDINISSFDFTPESVWFLKLDGDSREGLLYRYAKDKKSEVINSVFSFVCFDDNKTLVFRNRKQNQSGLSADLYMYNGESCVLIDENVDMHHLRYKNSGEFAYIKNYTEENGGQICVFVNNEVKQVESGVNAIVLY